MSISGRQKVFLSIAVAVLVIAAAAFVALSHQAATYWKVATLVGAPVPVQVVRAGMAAIDESLPAEGTAKEFENVPLSSLATGTVIGINARLGDKVRKGQRLIELDPVPLLATLKDAQDQLAGSKQGLAINTDKAAVMQELFDRKLVALDELNTALLKKIESERDVAKNYDSVVQAKVHLESARIDSPVSGIVTQRDIYVGTTLKSTTSIMTIAQIDPILIQAPFPEDQIRYIHIGQPAQVSFYAFPGQIFEGKVQWINPVIDNLTRLMTIQVVLSNVKLKLLPGMRGIVRLINQRAAVLRVPSIALLSTHEDFAYVFVVNANNIAHIRQIRIGAYAEGYMEVKSGLQAGEKVVVVGQVGLKDNSKVRIYDDPK